MNLRPSAFVDNLLTQLPAVRDHVVVLEQHVVDSARLAGRIQKQQKDKCAMSRCRSIDLTHVVQQKGVCACRSCRDRVAGRTAH
jgi:hypothetical protein